ncbi:MAG: hypothetical protein J6C41_08220 [Oscillospiraceae bacterium]|nr:hypothetical protein [Oscillospiraceae bacterium]
MKRLISGLIVLVMLCAFVTIPTSAAGNGSLSMSSASGYRGDTVTLSVYLNSNPGLVTMTIRVSYDTSALQLTNVSNSGLLVGAQLNTSYGSPYTISWVDGATTVNNMATGTIATFTFKILDTAVIGSSAVSLQFIDSYDTDYNENSFSASSAKVTVNCDHDYGDWEKLDNTVHSKSCSICTDSLWEAHKWNNGTVYKAASCKEEGIMTYTCTVCSASKTESIPKTNDHVFGNLTAVDAANHKDTCSVCQKEITEAHSWDNGKVTKPATCKEEGEKTITCTGCEYSKTEKIDKTPNHCYGAWQKIDENTHKHTCSVCSKEETANHSWNSGSVTKKATCKEEGEKTYTCTDCNATKVETIPVTTTHTWGKWTKVDADTHKRICSVCEKEENGNHSYKTSWSKDRNNHWHECSVCGDKKDEAKHTPGAEATETKAQTCTVCGYIIKAALGHKHDYATTWTTDDAGHWYACSGCAEKGSYADHDFENACDKDCSVCGYTRETEHKFSEAWTTDANNHWHECTGCGLKQDEAAHEPGPEATDTTAQTCTICGYKIAPALGEPETQVPTVQEDDPAADNGGYFPWWIVLAAVAVLGVGVVVVVAIKKKKG